METTHCEDLLEWLYEFHTEMKQWPLWPLSDMQIENIGLKTDLLHQCVEDLTRSNYITISQKSSNAYCELTPKGLNAGRKISQKHKVLSCFFTEMLGMKQKEASSEACILEHEISDETIQRLDTYLFKNLKETYLSSTKNITGEEEESVRTDHKSSALFLSEGKMGELYRILAIRGCNRLQRLTDLGLVPGASITIIQSLANSLVVTVKNCDIAISPEIASEILVIPWKNSA